jgi:hypothetical protein
MMNLQSPIVGWASAAVRLLDIYLGNARLVLDHVQRAMAQQRLQREHVSAGTQIRDGERVTESVWMALAYLSLPAQFYDHVAKRVTVQWAVELAHKQWRVGILAILPFGQVAPHSSPACEGSILPQI